jgi:DNA-binding PadR family transcriptional regulator
LHHHSYLSRFRRFARDAVADAREGRGGRHGRFHRHGERDAAESEEHGRHGRGHRGGRFGRFFEQGDLRLAMLSLIAEKPRHGYELIKAIEERAGGAYTPSPGVIYPTLTLLEDQGLIRPAGSEGAKRAFEITAEGTAFLIANKTALDAVLAKLGGVAESEGGGLAPQIVRARENLRLALRMRLARGKLTEAQITALAAALDQAATAIEQI